MPKKKKNDLLSCSAGDRESPTESMANNLYVDYTTSKNKVKMTLSISEIQSGIVIKGNSLENSDKIAFNLNASGLYLLEFHFGRKKYLRWIVVAPGDEPIHIHCKWRKSKAKIVIEQSSYSSRIVRKLTSKNPYLRLLQFQQRLRRMLALVSFYILGPSLFVEIVFIFLIIVLDIIKKFS